MNFKLACRRDPKDIGIEPEPGILDLARFKEHWLGCPACRGISIQLLFGNYEDGAPEPITTLYIRSVPRSLYDAIKKEAKQKRLTVARLLQEVWRERAFKKT